MVVHPSISQRRCVLRADSPIPMHDCGGIDRVPLSHAIYPLHHRLAVSTHEHRDPSRRESELGYNVSLMTTCSMVPGRIAISKSGMQYQHSSLGQSRMPSRRISWNEIIEKIWNKKVLYLHIFRLFDIIYSNNLLLCPIHEPSS